MLCGAKGRDDHSCTLEYSRALLACLGWSRAAGSDVPAQAGPEGSEEMAAADTAIRAAINSNQHLALLLTVIDRMCDEIEPSELDGAVAAAGRPGFEGSVRARQMCMIRILCAWCCSAVHCLCFGPHRTGFCGRRSLPPTRAENRQLKTLHWCYFQLERRPQ